MKIGLIESVLIMWSREELSAFRLFSFGKVRSMGNRKREYEQKVNDLCLLIYRKNFLCKKTLTIII
ncbi:hypothetical protein COL87_31090 [Bacillus pseudomycoides]|nr:hypothetical protein BLX05_30855 [Bacillus pseudomycoides]PDY08715.1 hypothetical protein COO16_29315 [Bacillus pseudomycoides]PEF71874.1 hypothetical protein CON94_29545 [Bacillus pseudomycoides]PEJ21473.1 hypothetical protein CN677_30445 [Bacillus pseudomycoides]PEL85019.1 hypothetical protein CN615_18475 [Bacillus pseudomycoides]